MRDRIVVRTANAILKLATRRYRERLQMAISIGMHQIHEHLAACDDEALRRIALERLAADNGNRISLEELQALMSEPA